MLALKCEICGGKLTAKSGGIFECEYCGLQYDKTRVQEMVQEIKGTVKIEGTVDVKGTVKIDGPVSIESSNSKNTLLNKAYRQLNEKEFAFCILTLYEILDIDPECSDAHIMLLCCTLNRKSLEELSEISDFDFESSRFKNAIKYGNSEQIKKLNNWKEKVLNNKNFDSKNKENTISALEARRKEIEPLQNMIQICRDVPYLLTPEGKIRCMEPNNISRIYDHLGIYELKNIKKFNFLQSRDLVLLDYFGNVYCMLLQEIDRSKKYVRNDIITDGSAIDICEYLGNIFILKNDGRLISFKTFSVNSKTCISTKEASFECGNVKQLISYKSGVYFIGEDDTKNTINCSLNTCERLPFNYDRTLYNTSVRVDGTVYCNDSRSTKNEWRNVVDTDFIHLNHSYDYAVLLDGSVVRTRDSIGSTTEKLKCENVAILKSGRKNLYALTDDGKFLTIIDDEIVYEEKIFESMENLKSIAKENYERACIKQDEILKEKKKLIEFEEELKHLIKERNNISGLFSGGRRREIQTQIDMLLDSIEKIKIIIDGLEKS